MRHIRPLLVLGSTLAVLAACAEDTGVNANARPPLAGVRYINALPDTLDVDIRMIDQVDWSATANKLAFRGGTEYFPVEAKPRRIRVFPQTGVDPAAGVDPNVVSQVLLDTTLTFEAGRNYTLLLAGRSRDNTEHFVVIEDDAPDPGQANIAVRTVNAGVEGNVDAYVVENTASPIEGTPTMGGVAPLSASGYVTRAAGAFATRTALTGSTTPLATGAAPAGAAGTTSINPLAGATVGGTALAVYVFPRSVEGSRAPQTAAFRSPGVVYFVDRMPAVTAVSP